MTKTKLLYSWSTVPDVQIIEDKVSNKNTSHAIRFAVTVVVLSAAIITSTVIR